MINPIAKIKEYPPEAFLSLKDLTDIFECDRGCIERMREKGRLSKGVVFLGCVYWQVAELRQFIVKTFGVRIS